MIIVKLTQFTRLLYRHSNNGSYQIRRTYSDKILPASDYFTWNTANPVKLHIGKDLFRNGQNTQYCQILKVCAKIPSYYTPQKTNIFWQI